jgi:hypothetical protein
LMRCAIRRVDIRVSARAERRMERGTLAAPSGPARRRMGGAARVRADIAMVQEAVPPPMLDQVIYRGGRRPPGVGSAVIGWTTQLKGIDGPA